MIENELKSYYFIQQAKEIKRNYYLGKNQIKLDEAMQFKNQVKEQLKNYQVEDTVQIFAKQLDMGSSQLIQHTIEIKTI